jgi:hypothetical protein
LMRMSNQRDRPKSVVDATSIWQWTRSLSVRVSSEVTLYGHTPEDTVSQNIAGLRRMPNFRCDARRSLNFLSEIGRIAAICGRLQAPN